MTTRTPQFPADWPRGNVVLSHDWLTGMRGGERVLEILCRGFPSAPIYTLLHVPSAVSETINAHRIRTSWLQSMPRIRETYRYYLPFFPGAIESFTPNAADLLISTSHCIAKGLRVPEPCRHLCYCFTPMRYAWLFFDEYFGRHSLKGFLARPVLSRLRRWDRRTSERVTRFVAISRHVQARIQTFYGRESDVVYPPVDTDLWTPGDRPDRSYDLIVSALVPYKRIDLAVAAYTRNRFPLKIVGAGTELRRLRSKAGGNIEFLGWQPDPALLDLYRNCRLLVFPGEEDFGIVPLEAQACGRPVVAFGRGGVVETVQEGVSGCFFETQTGPAIEDAIERAASRNWDPGVIREHALQFGVSRFISGISESIHRCMGGRGSGTPGV